MEFIESRMFVGAVLVALCHAGVTMESGEIEPSCVDARMTALKECFDPLVTDMVSEAPAPDDVNKFLCGDSAKQRLDCVIKEFNKCPDFVKESFLDQLKHDKGRFHAKDLFHVTSADEFCKCAPTNNCLEDIDVDKLGLDVDDAAWNRVANPAYICGLGHRLISCVAKALPGCTDYLQYKHNNTVDDDMPHFDVSTIMYADIFAEKRCKNWPDDKMYHACSERRATWTPVGECAQLARNYKDVENQQCGLRICIAKAMETCKHDDMGYYIDSINVFSDIKVETKPCNTSAASSLLATVITIIMTLCISLYL